MPYHARFDEPLAEQARGDTPRDALQRFDPRRAGLPDVTPEDARTYIEAHCAERPWLQAARNHSAEVQRVFAALDQGQGHAHQRHEGWPTDSMTERRARFLEDPAQLSPEERARSEDAFKPVLHRCGTEATRIRDADAFAVAFARGIEHPDIRRVLSKPYDADEPRPSDVSIPIQDLLGAEGYRYCSGYRLLPVGGSADAARNCRDAWADARRHDREPDVPEPMAERIGSLRDGKIAFFFRPDRGHTGYEVATMYVEAPRHQSGGPS